MKRFLGIVMGAVMALSIGVMAVGCSDRGSNGGGEENKIVVSILNQESERKMYEAVADAFEKANEGVTVKLMPLSNYETDVRSKLRSGERIDVLHVPDNFVTPFANDGVLENLEPFIESTEFDRSLYFDSMINMGKLNFNAESDQYMIPRDYSKFVVYYNKDIFDSCSVAYPKTGWTWSDFLETCRQLKQKMDQGYVCVDASMSYAILNYGMLASCGVEQFIDENYDLIADTSKMEEGLDMIKGDILDPGYAVKPEVYKDGDFVRMVAAMSIGVRPAFATYKNAELNFDVVEFPAIGSDPKVATGSSGFGIYTGSEVKDLAWEFISFVVCEEGQKIMSESGSIVPVLRSLAEDPNAEWTKITNGKNAAVNQTPFYSLDERDVVGDYWGDLPPEAVSLYNSYWATCMNDYLNGKHSMEECFDTFRKQITACKRMYPEYFE